METQQHLETSHNSKLDSAEIANLWTSYMNDTMATCVIQYFLQHVEDTEIKALLEYALHLSKQHIQTISQIFTDENIAIPYGFNEADVNLKAPRLYSDSFYLAYLVNMAKFGSNTYTVALANAARSDIRRFYTECGESSAELFNKSASVSISKGLFVRAPFIPAQQQAQYIQKQSFLSGWFGRRPLTAIEIMDLFFNKQRNEIGVALLIGFSQVATSQKVRDYMVRGKEIAGKHVEIFGSILSECDLPSPSSSDLMVMESTESPFSDKLMMFHTTALIAAGIGYYGASLGTSPRHDLSVHYTRLIGEIGIFADDGAKLMIQNGWLEQPPTAPDRSAIVKGTKS